MLRHLTVVATLLAFVTLAPAAASAQSPLTPEGWLLSPSIGIAFDSDADASLSIDVAAGYPLTPTLAVEGEIGHLFDTAPDDRELDSSLTTIHGSLLYFIDTAFAATPYLAAGLGAGHFSNNIEDSPASFDATEVGFNLGGGVTYPLERLWLRGDFRYFKHIDEIPSAWRLSVGVVFNLAN